MADHPHTPPCPFCNMPAEAIRSRNEHVYTIRDGFPVSEGHTLVIPCRHVASLFETTEEERAAIYEAIRQVCEELDRTLGPDGYNIGINDGEAAGQTVLHLHVHVIPRYKGDAKDPRGGIRWIFPDKAPYWEK